MEITAVDIPCNSSQPTAWRKILLKELMVTLLVKKFP
jgi:hypothetical protein